MNADPDTLDPIPSAVPAPPNGSPEGHTPPTSPPAAPERRARSKIGRLPKTTRDKLNGLIEDGVPLADIPPLLGDLAKDITARDLSRWRQSPHFQRWVLDQEWLQKLRDHQEPALDLMNDFDGPRFDQAALQLAVTRLFIALRHTDSGDLNRHLGGNAQTFARLVHALARACHEFTHIQKSTDAVTLGQLQKRDLDDDVSDNEYDLLVNKMDHVFRMPRRRRPPSVSSAVSSAVASAKAEASAKEGVASAKQDPPVAVCPPQPAPPQTGTPSAPANGHLGSSEQSPRPP